MPSNSTAILANGTLIQIATGTGGAKTVTGLALGFPTIVTSAAHGLNNGDVVTFAALAGNTTLNGLTLSIKNVTTNTFAVDVNTTGGAAWTSGGTATPVTFSTIGNAKSFSTLDGQNAEVDITNLQSPAKEFRSGFYDGGATSFDLDLDNADAGQVAARAAMQAGTVKQFKIIFPSGATPTLTFSATVRKMNASGQADGTIKGTLEVRMTGTYAFA
jgi:hypothetical protein